MAVSNTPVKELLDKAIPIKEKAKEWKLKKSVKKQLRRAMCRAFFDGQCLFDISKKQFIWVAERETIDRYVLTGVEPGMEFLVPIKFVKFGKRIHRVS